eukprot:TRINITY_DN17367_c0_g1_i1.p1 TRINITY_DN17367_c0_g1~~TRINITY_DN17367_c0_g1_i1.p1  ORF type:complete len:501 (-),score=62.89 TRINITY_DN17367_c0_g1_i1:197-1699(-)
MGSFDDLQAKVSNLVSFLDGSFLSTTRGSDPAPVRLRSAERERSHRHHEHREHKETKEHDRDRERERHRERDRDRDRDRDRTRDKDRDRDKERRRRRRFAGPVDRPPARGGSGDAGGVGRGDGVTAAVAVAAAYGAATMCSMPHASHPMYGPFGASYQYGHHYGDFGISPFGSQAGASVYGMPARVATESPMAQQRSHKRPLAPSPARQAGGPHAVHQVQQDDRTGSPRLNHTRVNDRGVEETKVVKADGRGSSEVSVALSERVVAEISEYLDKCNGLQLLSIVGERWGVQRGELIRAGFVCSGQDGDGQLYLGLPHSSLRDSPDNQFDPPYSSVLGKFRAMPPPPKVPRQTQVPPSSKQTAALSSPPPVPKGAVVRRRQALAAQPNAVTSLAFSSARPTSAKPAVSKIVAKPSMAFPSTKCPVSKMKQSGKGNDEEGDDSIEDGIEEEKNEHVSQPVESEAVLEGDPESDPITDCDNDDSKNEVSGDCFGKIGDVWKLL